MDWAAKAKGEIRNKLFLLEEREKELMSGFEDPTIDIGSVLVGLVQIRLHRSDWLQTWRLLFGDDEVALRAISKHVHGRKENDGRL